MNYNETVMAVGLFVGILATSIIQSSSTTTSMVVAFVASGALSVGNAIPIVMGANIGTTVTNTLVALGHITRKEEFKRAFSGSTLHDFFNIFTVILLFPIETCHTIVVFYLLWIRKHTRYFCLLHIR